MCRRLGNPGLLPCLTRRPQERCQLSCSAHSQPSSHGRAGPMAPWREARPHPRFPSVHLGVHSRSGLGRWLRAHVHACVRVCMCARLQADGRCSCPWSSVIWDKTGIARLEGACEEGAQQTGSKMLGSWAERLGCRASLENYLPDPDASNTARGLESMMPESNVICIKFSEKHLNDSGKKHHRRNSF